MKRDSFCQCVCTDTHTTHTVSIVLYSPFLCLSVCDCLALWHDISRSGFPSQLRTINEVTPCRVPVTPLANENSKETFLF